MFYHSWKLCGVETIYATNIQKKRIYERIFEHKSRNFHMMFYNCFLLKAIIKAWHLMSTEHKMCVDSRGRMWMTREKWLYEHSLSDVIFVEYEIHNFHINMIYLSIICTYLNCNFCVSFWIVKIYENVWICGLILDYWLSFWYSKIPFKLCCFICFNIFLNHRLICWYGCIKTSLNVKCFDR